MSRVQVNAKEGFRAFYTLYLGEHANRTCRRLHFVGTSLVLVIAVVAVFTGQWRWLWGDTGGGVLVRVVRAFRV